jgi:hypothetical protein
LAGFGSLYCGALAVLALLATTLLPALAVLLTTLLLLAGLLPATLLLTTLLLATLLLLARLLVWILILILTHFRISPTLLALCSKITFGTLRPIK